MSDIRLTIISIYTDRNQPHADNYHCIQLIFTRILHCDFGHKDYHRNVMKKIIGALIIAGAISFSVSSQESQTKVCGKKPDKVCRMSGDKQFISCYKTPYAQSYDVCKNEHGYYICCETPADNNTTYSKVSRAIGTTFTDKTELTGLGSTGTDVQQPQVMECKARQDRVCRFSPDKKKYSCYKRPYGQNYKVCKNESGYYICCEPQENNNTTYHGK